MENEAEVETVVRLGAPLAGVRLDVSHWRATDVVNGWLPGRELRRAETLGL